MKLYEQARSTTSTTPRSTAACFRHGDRLQSVREANKPASALSITTVLRAYLLLGAPGLSTAEPGRYYVPSQARAAAEARGAPVHCRSRSPSVVRGRGREPAVLSTLRSIATRDALPLGSPYPDAANFPFREAQPLPLRRRPGSSAAHGLDDALPPGHPGLPDPPDRASPPRQGPGRRPRPRSSSRCGADRGDQPLPAGRGASPATLIAVESPTFYAMLHAIERLGMRAVEIPTHPVRGHSTSTRWPPSPATQPSPPAW